MATVEELLESLISTQVSISDEQYTHDSSLSSQIDVLTSQNQVLSSQVSNIYESQGTYLSSEMVSNNQAFYTDVRGIKEMCTYQFTFIGVFIAFIFVWILTKGFLKRVSD
jgi:hypothetical protein